MKRPVLWVTGSLTAATALAATLLIVTATRGNDHSEVRKPAAIDAPVTNAVECRSSGCEPAPCGPPCPAAD